MEHRTETITRAAVALTALLLVSGSALAEKVYRWVDENGNVHYTESLPPGFKDTGHDVLNEQGIVLDENQRLTPETAREEAAAEQAAEQDVAELPRDSSGLPRPKPLYTEAEKQLKMDNFLMLRYESEQEITDAMNVEIKQLNYDRRLIQGSQNSIQEAYRGNIRIAANHQRAGKPVDKDTERQIAELQTRMNQNADELAALDKRERKIRDDFQAQLERYRFLVEQYADEQSG